MGRNQSFVEAEALKTIASLLAKINPDALGMDAIIKAQALAAKTTYEFINEVGLTTENLKTENFAWNSNLVFSLNRNKVTEIGNGVNEFFPVVPNGSLLQQQPVTVKVGDNVLYGKYAGTEIQIDGQDLLIMRESDILAIV